MQSGSLPYSGYAQASEHGRIRLYQWDCMELLKQTPDNYYGLCIVDPPYGIGISDFKRKNTKTAKFDGSKAWDDARPGPEYFDELFRVSCEQVIWGMNHLLDMLPPTRGFVSWFKHQNGNFSECELAWTSGNRGRFFDLPYQAESTPPKSP
jgi:site-specific DNA-methyltransferase (adenine-specific)